MAPIILYITVLMILSIGFSHGAYADSDTIYCYDEDMEGYICFDTRKECKKEQRNDINAESKCYKDTE